MPSRFFRPVPSISVSRTSLVPLIAAFVAVSHLHSEDAVPVEVMTAKLSENVAREFSLTGTVTSQRQARLSSRTEGLVSELAVDAGSEVSKDDVLMTLDTRLAEIELDLIEAEIEAAEVELEDAKRRVEEVAELVKKGGFPKSQAESLEAAVRIRSAELKRLQVRRAAQQERIERHKLVAPFSGVIGRKLTEAGEWVDTGNPVVELIETARVWFDLRVPQEFLAPVRGAEKVEVVLDAFPDAPLDGKIAVMVPVKDEVSRTFLTRLEMEDPDGQAAPGMSGKARIFWRPAEGSTVKVPRDAVVRFPDGSANVWVVETEGENGAGKAMRRDIKTAGAMGELVEVVSGLKGGESVVIRGNEGLREGQPVMVRDVDESIEQGTSKP